MKDNEREEFWRTLCSLPGTDPQAESEKLGQTIKYPRFLYRYRSVSPKSLEALRTNKLYFSTANYYDDPFDTFLHIDIDEIRSAFSNVFQTPERMTAVVNAFKLWLDSDKELIKLQLSADGFGCI